MPFYCKVKHYRLKPLLLAISLAISIVLILIQCVDKRRCDRYSDYLSHKTYGSVIKKYIDDENHARKTILLELTGTKNIEIEVTLFCTGLYDSLNIGEVVSKEEKSPTTTLIRGRRKIEFTVMKSDYCKE